MLDQTTGEVRIDDYSNDASQERTNPESNQPQTAQVTPAIFDGLASATATIAADSSMIHGLGRTVISCPFGGQEAFVSGFMASTVARDPVAGIRDGFITQDNFLTSASDVNFSIIRIPGGAKNPQNRTTMETTHNGFCGDELFVRQQVATWPPLRIDIVMDDTGSMGDEIGGLKSALTSFINSRNSDPTQPQRGVSYELISFKDSPRLRLANTEDTAAAINAVGSLSASGGGDCPEDALGGLGLALNRLEGDENYEGSIVLATDASPHNGDISGLIARAQAEGIRINVLLTGDCVAAASTSSSRTATTTTTISPLATLSAREVFSRIAEETDGEYVYAPGGTAEEYAQVLEDMFDSALSGGDSEPPEVTVTVTPNELWPVNHRVVPIGVSVSAVDDKDPSPLIALESITSSEPANGQGDGNTEEDILVEEDGTIYLRAERSGNGEGRVYTITYRATDANGNAGFGSAEVLVPHSKGK